MGVNIDIELHIRDVDESKVERIVGAITAAPLSIEGVSAPSLTYHTSPTMESSYGEGEHGE